MSELDAIVKMLASPNVQKQVAACIVLGELRAKRADATAALARLVEGETPGLQRHALEALTSAGTTKHVLTRAMSLAASGPAEVREAASAAIRALGEDAVPAIRARLPTATPEERRALDALLAELGGKDAFSTLLQSLSSSDAASVKAATLAVRQHVKAAGARERRGYVTATAKFLERLTASKTPLQNQSDVVAAALKILGYLEDERAVPTLLAHATSKTSPAHVKQEALISLRFAMGASKGDAKIVAALLEAAEAPDRTLAHTALHTLATLEVPASALKRLERLLSHEDGERARFALAWLASQRSPAAVSALVGAVGSLPRALAEIAAESLAGRQDAAGALADALTAATDPDRAWLLRKVLLPLAKGLEASHKKALLDLATTRFVKDGRGWEAAYDVAKEADPSAALDALRAAARKLGKQGDADRAATALALVCKSERATDADRLALAIVELDKSGLDTRASARANDPALQRLAGLSARGFDVAGALKKHKELSPERAYYVGFHFAEEGHPLGRELLALVAERGGRTKLGKMAKNKLALTSEP